VSSAQAEVGDEAMDVPTRSDAERDSELQKLIPAPCISAREGQAEVELAELERQIKSAELMLKHVELEKLRVDLAKAKRHFSPLGVLQGAIAALGIIGVAGVVLGPVREVFKADADLSKLKLDRQVEELKTAEQLFEQRKRQFEDTKKAYEDRLKAQASAAERSLGLAEASLTRVQEELNRAKRRERANVHENQKRVAALTAELALQQERVSVAMQRVSQADLGEFKDCGDCPIMIRIPAGTFTMGSPYYYKLESEQDEGPIREVTVSRFSISKTEVTRSHWAACVRAGKCEEPPEKEGGHGDDRPITQVSWQDALNYTNWLSQVTGHPYRLPAEAEWEYAARAGTSTPFSFGDTITPEQVNFNPRGRYPSLEQGYFRMQTVSVGSLPPNPWGLHEVHGNVWEWVEDDYHISYVNAPANGSAWVDSPRGKYRVIRGGSWLSAPSVVRSASRRPQAPDFPDDLLGFRVARSAQ